MTTQQATQLRAPTAAEQAFHDNYVKDIVKEAKALTEMMHSGEIPDQKRIDRFIARMGDVEKMVRRYGWHKTDPDDPLMINEALVWQAIREDNPLPDPLLELDDQAGLALLHATSLVLQAISKGEPLKREDKGNE